MLHWEAPGRRIPPSNIITHMRPLAAESPPLIYPYEAPGRRIPAPAPEMHSPGVMGGFEFAQEFGVAQVHPSRGEVPPCPSCQPPPTPALALRCGGGAVAIIGDAWRGISQ
jgi:hypothetical protein